MAGRCPAYALLPASCAQAALVQGLQVTARDLTVTRLREVLEYEAETGLFKWLVVLSNVVRSGSIAGCLNKYGYRLIRIDGNLYLAHRLAWLYMHGQWPENEIDHINGETSDNRISNLRQATRSQNMQNEKVARKSNKSCGLLGVSKNGRGWKAEIKVDGKKLHLGSYKTPSEAHDAYVLAKGSLHQFSTFGR